jgi:hypothetical protein
MHVYNIHLELQMEIEQRYVVSHLHRKGMKLPAIVAGLAAVYHENAFDENRVKYWPPEIKLHCSDLNDRSSSGRRPLEDIDARILEVLEAEPWSSLQTIAEFLKIPGSMVHLHLTTSLSMENRHFKRVPLSLDDDLRAKRFDGARQLLDVLQAQERHHFRDLVTGDETWVYLGIRPGTIWLPTEAELPVRVKRTIASEKRMLTVFWGIHGIAHYYWLQKDNILDSPFICEEILAPLVQKMQQNSKKLANPRFIWIMQRFTRKGQPKRNWMFPDSNARQGQRLARILHCPTFFGWLKSQLERREYHGEDELYELYELYEVVDGILTRLSIGMIETVFVDWMNRL